MGFSVKLLFGYNEKKGIINVSLLPILPNQIMCLFILPMLVLLKHIPFPKPLGAFTSLET